MKIKKTWIIALLFLAGCGKSADSEVVPPSDLDGQAETVGPFSVAFDGGENYEHSFKVPVAQDAGKVEYFIATPAKSRIQLLKADLRVTGCPSSQVKFKSLWIPDETKPTVGQVIMPGLSFESKPGVKGVLIHEIRGMDGCSDIELVTSLKRTTITSPNPTFPVGQTCEGTTPDQGCKVQVYCKEQNPLSQYVEVEVWKQSWGMTTKKFMHSADGKRTLMLMETVSEAIGTSTSSYDGVMSSLSFSHSTGVGNLVETIGGQKYATKLDCAAVGI